MSLKTPRFQLCIQHYPSISLSLRPQKHPSRSSLFSIVALSNCLSLWASCLQPSFCAVTRFLHPFTISVSQTIDSLVTASSACLPLLRCRPFKSHYVHLQIFFAATDFLSPPLVSFPSTYYCVCGTYWCVCGKFLTVFFVYGTNLRWIPTFCISWWSSLFEGNLVCKGTRNVFWND